MSILVALGLAVAATGGADPAIGLWSNPKGSITVRTRRCGAQLCGTVVAASPRAREKAAKGGTPQLVGTELFSDYRREGAAWAGTLFLPDRGRRVSSTLATDDGQTLKVSGCLIGRILCKSQVWNRVDGRLARN